MSRDRTPESVPTPLIYPADLTPSLQTVLAALADLDAAYERDIERLRREALPEPLRLQIAQELERLRRQDREALLRRLEELSPYRQVA